MGQHTATLRWATMKQTNKKRQIHFKSDQKEKEKKKKTKNKKTPDKNPKTGKIKTDLDNLPINSSRLTIPFFKMS